MRKILLSISIVLFGFQSYSQVGGLSASKLGTLCASTVGEGNIEFEPSFAYSNTKHYFDGDGHLQALYQSSDSSKMFSGSAFRFTYGLIKDLEIGVSLPIDVSDVRFGAKYRLPFNGEKFATAILGGYTAIVGNRVYSLRHANHESTSSYYAGIIMTYNYTPKFSIDFDVQYQKHFVSTEDHHTQGLYLNTDIGYYLLEKINFIVGLNYNFQSFSDREKNSHLLTLNTGLAIERAKHFILVLNAPFDIMGKNTYRTNGFGLALTILLD